MRIYLTLLFLTGLFISVQAQTMHVYYDAFHDSITYKIDGKTVDKPLVKKGNPIILHVTNYNNYLYDLKVSTEEENYTTPSSGMASMLFGGEGGGGGGGLDMLKGLINSGGGIPDFGQGGGDDPTFAFGADGSAKTPGKRAQTKLIAFNQVIKDVKEVETNIQNTDEQLTTIITRQENAALMREEVSKLRTDASLSPQTSRRLMLEYLEELLDIKKGKKYDLDDLFKQADVQKNFMTQVGDYEENIRSYELKTEVARSLAGELKEFNLPATQTNGINFAVDQFEERIRELRGKVANLRDKAPELLDENMSDLITARHHYEELKDHRFEKQMTIYPEGDITTLNISLVPLDNPEQSIPVRTASPIKLRSYGGIQINASVGISFASLFDRPLDYINPEGVIIGDELDAFTPVVTSFIHFYGQSKRSVSLAGTIGLGLGIGGEQSGGVGGLSNYFAGPSLIIGNGQRVVLTGGITGSKVNRLANGLVVGQEFSESTIPLKSLYELGFFFGVSFNVLGN